PTTPSPSSLSLHDALPIYVHGSEGRPHGIPERIAPRVAHRPEAERETVLRPGGVGVLRGLRTHVVGSPNRRLDCRSNGHGLGTALASAAARVGRRVLPPQRATLAGRACGGRRRLARAAALHPGLLPLSR